MKYSNTTLMFMMNSKKSQSGLSIIELLVSMFIGLFLLVGVTTTYLSSKKTSIVRDQNSELEDNGRIALDIMSKTLQHTGYTSVAGGLLENKFILENADIENITCSTPSVVTKTIFPAIITADAYTEAEDEDEDGKNNESDSLGVVYFGDSNISTDCAGGPLPATCQVGTASDPRSARIYNAFFVDTSSNLRCAGSRSSDSEIIAEYIENIQVLYGVDTNNDNIVDSFLNASTIEGAPGPNGLWQSVISIQLAVLVRSSIEVKQTAEAETFTLLDEAYTVPSADRYKRAVFSTTITLRNSIN